MAKTLYLVRHAKSSWADLRLSDFDRQLNERGLRDAPEMGQRLKQRKIIPEIILCSPAQRTRQTLELLDLGAEALFNERIYEASVDVLLDIIQALDDRFGSAMIIGHNPAIDWLAKELSDIHIERMPTCAVVTLELAAEHWKEAGRCNARLLDYDYPKRPPND